MFEFLINTGEPTLSGSIFSSLAGESAAGVLSNGFFRNGDYATGSFETLVSLNSQHLVEDSFEVTELFGTEFVGTSGDYYNRNLVSRFANIPSDFPSFSSGAQQVLIYEKPYNQSAIYFAETTGSIATGLLAAIAEKLPDSTGDLHALEFFANGQKLYSGHGYEVTANTGLSFNVDFTGKFWAWSQSADWEIFTGQSKDLSGVNFVGNDSIYRSYGMLQGRDLYLELDSGVSIIEDNLIDRVMLDEPQIIFNRL